MRNCVFSAVAKSKTISAEYTVEICLSSPSQCRKYENKAYFEHLCSCGCKNYKHKWSCPPFSPSFSDISLQWSNLYIFYMRMPMNAFATIKNDYLKIKAANSMLKSRADRYMRAMSSKHGKYISTGSCRLCKPCKILEGKSCAHPSLMAYSFESLGINVETLINEHYDNPLLWYKKGELPEYTSVVCGLLTNDDLTFDELKQEYFAIIRE